MISIAFLSFLTSFCCLYRCLSLKESPPVTGSMRKRERAGERPQPSTGLHRLGASLVIGKISSLRLSEQFLVFALRSLHNRDKRERERERERKACYCATLDTSSTRLAFGISGSVYLVILVPKIFPATYWLTHSPRFTRWSVFPPISAVEGILFSRHPRQIPVPHSRDTFHLLWHYFQSDVVAKTIGSACRARCKTR